MGGSASFPTSVEAFLNSLIPCPRCFARSGIFLEPNRRMMIKTIMIHMGTAEKIHYISFRK